MRKYTSFARVAASLLLLLGGFGAAQASLIGDDVEIQTLEVPTDADVGTPTVVNSVVVAVVNGPEVDDGGVLIDIGSESISFLWSGSDITFDDFFFSGVAFLGLDWVGEEGFIVGLLGGETNIVGFDIDRVLFDQRNVAFNFADLTLTSGNFIEVTLDVEHVPEPAMIALMLIGFAGFAGYSKVRRRA